MEVGKGKCKEIFLPSLECNDFDDDDDDDDGHFVIALDESGQENDELDDGIHNRTEKMDDTPSTQIYKVDLGFDRGKTHQNTIQGFPSGESVNVVSNSSNPGFSGTISNEMQSLSLCMDCTTDEDDTLRNTPNQSVQAPAQDVLKVPNFLVSSPDVIKRLKSSLHVKSAVSHSCSDNTPSSLASKAPVTSTVVNGDVCCKTKAAFETNRKLDFCPQADCTCIMCGGWDPSKVTTQEVAVSTSSTSVVSSHGRSSIESRDIVSSVSNSNTGVVSSYRVRSVGNKAIICHVSNSNTCVDSFPAQGQTYSTPKNDLVLPFATSCEKLKLNKSTTAASGKINVIGSKTKDSCLKEKDLNFSQKSFNPILKQNGSYFMLFPQPNKSTQQGIAFIKKMIPEIKTKEGQVLVLTNAFVTSYQPDLRPLIERAKKLDLSVPGTLCIVMSDVGQACSESVSKNSGTPIQLHKSQNIHPPSSTLESKTHALPSSISNAGVSEAVLKVIYTHLQKNDFATAANLNKTSNVSQSVKQHPVSNTHTASKSSNSNNPLVSNQKLFILPKRTTASEANVVLLSNDSVPNKQISLSSLPPPPPLVRCPSIPVEPHNRCTSAPVLHHSSSSIARVPLCITTSPTTVKPQMSFVNSRTLASPSNNCASATTTTLAQSCDPAPVSLKNTDISSSLLPLNHTSTPSSQKTASPMHSKCDVEEAREILVIPFVNKEMSTRSNICASSKDSPCFYNTCASTSNAQGFIDSSSLYTLTAPLETSPSQLQKTQETLQKNALGSDTHRPITHVLPVMSKVSLENDHSKSSISPSSPATMPNTVTSKHNLEIATDESPASESSFPLVVKVNLSSCANISHSFTHPTPSCSTHFGAPSIISSSPVPTTTTSISPLSSNSESYLPRTFSTQKDVLSPGLCSPCTPIGNLPTHSFKASTSTLSSLSSTVPSPHTLSFQDSTLNQNNSLAVFTQPLSNYGKLVSNDMSFRNTTPPSSVPLCSSSKTISTSCFTSSLGHERTSTALLPSASSSAGLMSSPTAISPWETASSSSVSVNGLKLKIRLGDAKSNLEIGETKSDTTELKSNLVCNQVISVGENLSTKRKESAEEMFQRFQEEAMKEVYNAQFGVGNLSRSLRPSRSNISFIDKNIPIFRLNDGKKKKQEEGGDRRKSTEEIKRNHSANESLQKVPENDCKHLSKVGKKRHSSGDSRSEISNKEPEYDINDFPKLAEDKSILMKKTIYTPNIMAGHKVFVKFNVFSNPQSGRNFLIPFFNLGGSRVQFDNEDMDYIKKSVIEVEKEEKFCARHLIYYSREDKKASFVRKENLAQMNVLSDKSYKKCSYILEGFSRESSKRSVPLPGEWKVDKKVSIEIDTADVDSNVVIDFENSLADAVVSNINESVDSVIAPEKSTALVKSNSLDHVASSCEKTMKLNNNHWDHSESQYQKTEKLTEAKQSNTNRLSNINLCGHESKNQNAAIVPLKNFVHSGGDSHDHASLVNVQSQSTSGEMYNGIENPAKSSCYRPNILRKKTLMLKPDESPNLPYSNSQLIPDSSECNPSPVSSVNYTDQLKELFTSGNLHNTFPLLKEGSCNQNNDNQSSSGNNNGSSSSKPFSFVPIKEEIIDNEYEQSTIPHSLTNSSMLSQKESFTLLQPNCIIKSEPRDEHFDLLQKSPRESAASTVFEDDRDMSGNILPVTVTASNIQPPEIENVISEKENLENNEKVCSPRVKVEPDDGDDDDETLSTYSEALPISSAVSESSEVLSSSCVDTSDEDICSDDEQNDPSSLGTQSYTNIIYPSHNLLDESSPHNSCNTKITSLVESLKQRLSERTPAALPSVFTESSKQSSTKLRKKKTSKGKKTLPSQFIPYNSTDVNNSVLCPLSGSEGPTESQKVKLDVNQNSHTKCLSKSINSSQVAVLSNEPSFSFPTVSKEASSHISAASTHSEPEKAYSGTCYTESHENRFEFKKRFPFITSGGKVEFSHISNNGTNGSILQGSMKQSEPLNMLDKQSKKSRLQWENLKELVTEVSTASPHLSIIPVKGKVESASCIDDDSESDIDVGSENIIFDNPNANISESKWFLSSPPLPASGRRHLRDFTRENEFVVPKNSGDMSSNNGSDSKVSSKKFVLPIRPRTKSKTAKVKQNTVNITNPPSTASLLCQKLDISVEPMKPKLKGKLVMPLEIDTSLDMERNQSDPMVSHDLPKPINPGFKPTINAIFGVTDIPKSLDTVINKPSSSKVSVAKKSSGKNSRGNINRQVARKGTTDKYTNAFKHQNTDRTVHKKTSVESESASSSVNNQNQTKEQLAKKGTGKKVKASKGTTLRKDQRPIQNGLVPEAKTKSKSIQKKVNIKSKQHVANRKLGSLLIEVNRYSSLRKFAWRKYSSFKEKTYIIETSENDIVPKIVEKEKSGAKKKRDDGTIPHIIVKGNSEKYSEDKFDIKPCKLVLYKLEDMQWEFGEIPVKTEGGTYIIKHSQEHKKHTNRVSSDILKRRKKKSIMKRHKKGSGKQRPVKKDIVDYYTAAIESLRKKALLLEADSRNNSDKTEMKDQPVIKQEIVEPLELNENKETMKTGNQENVKEVEFLQQPDNIEKCSPCDSSEMKNDASSVVPVKRMRFTTNEEFDEILSTNNGEDAALVDKFPQVGSELNVGNSSPPGPHISDINTFQDMSTPNGLDTSAADYGGIPSSDAKYDFSKLLRQDIERFVGRKCVKMVERNYEGEMIQALRVSFQDQSGIEDTDMDEVDPSIFDDERDKSVENLAQEIEIFEGDNWNAAAEENISERNQEIDQDIGTSNNESLIKGSVQINENYNVENISKTNVEKTDLNCERAATEHEQVDKDHECDNEKEENKIRTPIFAQEFSGIIKSMECNDNFSESNMSTKLPPIEENLAASDASEIPELFQKSGVMYQECSGDSLTETKSATGCNFIHKDIVLGFEDALGADTVLSKLAAEGEEDMFLLGNGDDDVENIGLIPDEEVERLLGLDLNNEEEESSTLKLSENKKNARSTDSATDKLCWSILPENENCVNVDDLTCKNAEKLPSKYFQTSTQQQSVLKVDTCCSDNASTDVSSDKSISVDKKPAKISPSWKRILGTQALMEIKESVSNTIATASAKKESCHSQMTETKSNLGFKTDKLNLKLCTGALSKAFKLSAEMKKSYGDFTNEPTYGDFTNEPTSITKRVEDGRTNFNHKSLADKLSAGDWHSFLNIAKSDAKSTSNIVDHESKGRSEKTPGGNDVNVQQTNVACDDKKGKSSPANPTCTKIITSSKHGGVKKIDLTKLKMKLTPILASAKAKSTISSGRSIDMESLHKNHSSVPMPSPEKTEQKSLTVHGMISKQQIEPRETNVKKKIAPLLNTEKLTNILKNFKKPPNLNLPSTSKTSKGSPCNLSLSSPSQTDANASCDSTQIVLEQKLTNRKRMSSSLSVKADTDSTLEVKKSKLSVFDNHNRQRKTETVESEEEKGERSCFDCLSVLKSS